MTGVVGAQVARAAPPGEFAQATLVMRRETVQFRRQRAALLRVALLPMLYVSIVFVTPNLLVQHQASTSQPVIKLSITQAVADASFGEFLQSLDGVRATVSPSPSDDVRNGNADVAVATTASGGVTLGFDPDNERSRLALALTTATAADFNLVQTVALLNPSQQAAARQSFLQARPKNVTGRSTRSLATLGSLLGFGLLAFIARSSNVFAIEKDRRTAEALLVLPLTSRAVVLGKSAFLMVQAAATAVIAVGTAEVGGQLAGKTYHLNHGASALGLTLVHMMIVAALLVAIGALIGTVVRGVTESVVWTSFAALPMVAAAVTLPFLDKPASWLRWVPFFGQFRGIQDALTLAPSWGDAVGVTLVSLAATIGILVLAVRFLRSDNAVLRATH
jgi:ABC-type transport system involved in multi-copper enzyme maturation permease subunit